MRQSLRLSFIAVACLLCECDDNDRTLQPPVDAGGQQPGKDAGGQQPGKDAGGQHDAADAQANRGEGLFAWAVADQHTIYYVISYNRVNLVTVRTFHEGGETPRIERFGNDCFVFSGFWTDVGQAEPSYGRVVLTATRGLGPDAGGREGELTLYRWPDFYQQYGDWEEGWLLTMKAEGDEMPGFEVSGTVPEWPPPDLTTLDMSGSQDIELERNRPLTLEWMPESGEVQVRILQILDWHAPPIRGLRCVFDAEAGQGTIPAEAMSKLHEEDIANLEISKPRRTEFHFERVHRTTMKVEALDLEYAVTKGRSVRVAVE